MRRGATWRETPLTAPNTLEHPRSCADTRLRNRRALQQPPRSPSDPQTPLATFGRFRKPNQPETPQYASVFPGRQSRRRTTPAENRTEVQDPWRNRRPFPPEPPRIRRGATAGKAAAAVSANAGATRSITGGAIAGEAAAADAHVAKRMLAPDAPQTIARKRSWRTPVGPRIRPYKKQLSSTPPTRQKSHP